MKSFNCVWFTHWGRVTHICVSKLTIIGSDNGLSPGRRQAIIWTSAGILLIRTLGTNFSEMLSEIHAFWLKKMHLKMSSAKWRPFYLGLNVLTQLGLVLHICVSQQSNIWFRWWPLAFSPPSHHKPCLLSFCKEETREHFLVHWQQGKWQLWVNCSVRLFFVLFSSPSQRHLSPPIGWPVC